jgi:tetratricopeptide (TPR) repeat protein
MQMAGDTELKQTISEVHNRLRQQGFFEKTARQSPILTFIKSDKMKRVLALAAMLVVVAGVVWWSFFRTTPVDTATAFNQYFKPETTQVKGIIRGLESFGMIDSMTQADSLREALKLYDEGKYNDAVAALDTFLLHHPENDTASFYLAMSHLNETRYAKAVELLTPLADKEDFALQDDAKWYLALCFLKVDNGLDKAVSLFTDLSEDPDYKDRKAASGMVGLLKQK